MPLDDRVLSLQRRLDRVVRRLRLGRAPHPGRRRLLIVQIVHSQSIEASADEMVAALKSMIVY